MPIYKKKLYRVIFMLFFVGVRFTLTATFTLTFFFFPTFSCTDSDFVDPDCLKPVSSVQYLSLLGSWPLYQLSKSLSFILKKSDVCSFYCQLSNTVSLEQQQVCWSVCWRSNICLKPVVSVFFSLHSFFAITAIFLLQVYCWSFQTQNQ